MTAFPKYPNYKASGVEWLGDVPEHWEVERLKGSLIEVDQRSTTGTETLLSLRMNVGLVPHNEVSTLPITSAQLIGYKKVAPGQVVMNRMRASSGIFAVATSHGLVSPDYAVFQPRGKQGTDYLLSLFKTGPMMTEFRRYSTGLGTGESGFLRLYSNFFFNIRCPIPPKAEENRIVAYLDEKTAEIDRLIAKKQRQIELLDEQKAILINRAVTRGVSTEASAKAGLHPQAELQDSGIEGIGHVPAHWRIVQNRRLFTERSRKITNSHETPLSLSQVDGVIPSDEMKERSLSPSHRDNFKLCLPGDLILNRFKAHLGVFFESPYRGAITYHYGVFEPHEGIQTKYFEFLFHTEAYRTIFAGVSNGMSIGLQNLSNNNFYQVLSVVPPVAEQAAIVKHAERVVVGTTAAIQRIESQIQTLQTLRSTLIAHAVTGKIKVA